MTAKVHVAIVLDRSGSMESCRADAIGAVNSYLRQVRDDANMAARVSLVTFDSESIDVIRDRVAAKSCAELTAEEYQPRASTPLFDAVGSGAGLLDRHAENGEKCILAVMTDGQENASKEFARAQIKALLDRKQKENDWLVLYLGAGHDSWAQASAIGVKRGHTADYDAGNLGATSGPLYAISARYVTRHEGDPDAEFTDAERAAMNAPNPPGGEKT